MSFNEEEFKKMVQNEEDDSLLVPPSSPDEDDDSYKDILNTKQNKKTALDADAKFSSKAGKVVIDLESSGRFDSPNSVSFSDYDIEDVNSLALSREEDLLENLLFILDKQKHDNFNVRKLTLEEFYEVMIGIKMQFNTTLHEHAWMCSCQEDIPEHRQKPSKQEIDLTKIRYVSIEEADEKLKEQYKELFDKQSDADFEYYVRRKYNLEENAPLMNTSKEKELSLISIKEPLLIKEEGDDGNVKNICFRFNRIEDLSLAAKMASEKFNWIIRKTKNSAGNASEDYYDKEVKDKLEKLNIEKAKYALLVSKANSLISINGVEINNIERKIELYSKFKRSTLLKLGTMIEMAAYGVQHEFETQCDKCGKKERRLLQRAISPLDFIPFDNDKKSGSSSHVRKHSEYDIFFGV